ncbi:MAG: hypothetical protein LLG01_19485 [Planctomycetaceae bacterium]|nr:hypothetical protein [Planctomycetaceae bacterium]
MTLRAIILGLVSAVAIACGGYLCGLLAIGKIPVGHFPVFLFGLLFVALVAGNPLLHLIRPSWRLSGRELALVLGMSLVACSLPSDGLMRYWTQSLLMPRVLAGKDVGLKNTRVLDYVPHVLLVDAVEKDPAAVRWLEGADAKDRPISLAQVPWDVWRGPAIAWGGMTILLAMMVICVALSVHRQWAYSERLRYPIAEFADTILTDRPGRALGSVFGNPLFWVPFLLLTLMRVMHGAQQYTQRVPNFSLGLDLSGFQNVLPTLLKTPGGEHLTHLSIIPAVVAITFFLGSDIGLSLGLLNVISVAILYTLMQSGVSLGGDANAGGLLQWQNFGAFLGYGLLIAYVGRRYYYLVVRSAVGWRHSEVPAYAAWACRLGLLAAGALIVVFIRLGLAWPLAILTLVIIVLLFIVMARINAECGIFFYSPLWRLPGVMVGLFGLTAIGPSSLVLIGLISLVLIADPFECLIPYVTNALKIGDGQGIKPARSGASMAGAYVLALVAVIVVALWADYNFGSGMGGETPVVKGAFVNAQKVIKELNLTGHLAQSELLTPWQRVTSMRPDGQFLTAVALGAVALLVLGQMRLKFPWWPLHPVILLGLGVSQLQLLSASCLLGWMIKTGIMRFGGGATYQKTKIIMIGVIAGELVGATVWLVTNWILYGATGMSWVWYVLIRPY